MAKFSEEVTFSQYKIIWQWNNNLNMGPFKKYIPCIIAFFTPFTSAHFTSFTVSLSLYYTLKTRNYIGWERKRFLAYMAAYIKGGRK